MNPKTAYLLFINSFTKPQGIVRWIPQASSRETFLYYGIQYPDKFS